MMVAAPAGSVPVAVLGGISTARARFAPTFDAAGAVVRRGSVFARFLVAAFVAVFFFFAAILLLRAARASAVPSRALHVRIQRGVGTCISLATRANARSGTSSDAPIYRFVA